MKNPISTYRLQFHQEFTFEAFERIIPYLQQLGVSTIYASPIFSSTPGSTHGYDSINPHCINPEIGTEEDLFRLHAQLKEQQMGWLQDIVPNHMAFHPGNPWLIDVLEKGKQSRYAGFFDIGWENPVHEGKIMIPFLGNTLEEVITNRELKIDYKNDKLVLSYFDNFYPLNPRSYQTILSHIKAPNQSLETLLTQMTPLHQVEDKNVYAEEWEEFLDQLASLYKLPANQKELESVLTHINSQPEILRAIANEQVYALCHWEETDQQINFRRFFTVNSLICLNIQDKDVFDHFHRYIKELRDKGIFTGLRIDHIDGLYNPTKYLDTLRQVCGEDTYITVEKILEPGENLPHNWKIQGNTGYDFLATVNNLFTNQAAEKKFTQFYEKLLGDKTSIDQQILEKKAFILRQHMQGELENLYNLFTNSQLASETELAGISPSEIKTAIAEVLIHCPVYRYYGNQLPLAEDEQRAFNSILKKIRKSKPELENALQLMATALFEKPLDADTDYQNKALHFYQRLMQFSGPLMAKGVEDTLMYTYNRFIAHNEVGDSPSAFGISIEDFHAWMIERQKKWPFSINTTSTHDTKRGEDVRARLNVLSDIADEWLETIELWQYLNTHLKKDFQPDENDEYFIYQTLIGAHPMPDEDEDHFSDRVQEYLEKALREAKLKSSWAKPDEEYENASKQFALSLLQKDKPFWRHFEKMLKRIADYGIINSLVQVLLKFTCPGVPDVYQGCELWDFSLVDPDNRRPVDYEKRSEWLNELQDTSSEPTSLTEKLWQERYSGKIKLWLSYLLFTERKNASELFEKAEYIPLKVKGKYKHHILAFARKHQQNWYVVAVPLHVAAIDKMPANLFDFNWKDTRILLPEDAPDQWEDTFLKTTKKVGKKISVTDLFGHFPLTLLKSKSPENNRSAGILMHITSLPSNFGLGDLGTEAKRFAKFLQRSRQKLWQILPLSPTEAGQGYSPYSAISSMAGNTLLISPEVLVNDGLLDDKDLKGIHIPVKEKADFASAEKIKDPLFEKAYQNFLASEHPELKSAFSDFCEREAYWLDDYALYISLKLRNEGKPWYEWEKRYKLRDKDALKAFAAEETYTIGKTKWLQYIFMKQWQNLKHFSNNLGVQLFGDLPFYVSYDSSDVWANPEIFALNEDGSPAGIAGVPPDYFNENGQLWGMPVFKWDVLKEQGYEWWINRIRKNIELFDYLRLDHFRAFSTYWDVPASEETARNGEWIPGPAADFFEALEQRLGKLPFVAEDLGDIDQLVYDLRDQFNFPGMKVLQFAFGDNLPQSVDIPHNYGKNFLVYTGTHDNNTTLGWYRQETNKSIRKNLESYTNQKVKQNNVHKILARLAYASIAKTVILPLQDVIGLNENYRMNQPSVAGDNWTWRLLPDQLTEKHEKRLKKWVKLYNR